MPHQQKGMNPRANKTGTFEYFQMRGGRAAISGGIVASKTKNTTPRTMEMTSGAIQFAEPQPVIGPVVNAYTNKMIEAVNAMLIIDVCLACVVALFDFRKRKSERKQGWSVKRTSSRSR